MQPSKIICLTNIKKPAEYQSDLYSDNHQENDFLNFNEESTSKSPCLLLEALLLPSDQNLLLFANSLVLNLLLCNELNRQLACLINN